MGQRFVFCSLSPFDDTSLHFRSLWLTRLAKDSLGKFGKLNGMALKILQSRKWNMKQPTQMMFVSPHLLFLLSSSYREIHFSVKFILLQSSDIPTSQFSMESLLLRMLTSSLSSSAALSFRFFLFFSLLRFICSVAHSRIQKWSNSFEHYVPTTSYSEDSQRCREWRCLSSQKKVKDPSHLLFVLSYLLWNSGLRSSTVTCLHPMSSYLSHPLHPPRYHPPSPLPHQGRNSWELVQMKTDLLPSWLTLGYHEMWIGTWHLVLVTSSIWHQRCSVVTTTHSRQVLLPTSPDPPTLSTSDCRCLQLRNFDLGTCVSSVSLSLREPSGPAPAPSSLFSPS